MMLNSDSYRELLIINQEYGVRKCRRVLQISAFEQWLINDFQINSLKIFNSSSFSKNDRMMCLLQL